mmetsp:Transcript_7832/g.19208  ORF Transcript_7832/g.19208 Transcript_7832/m.19208 type:complete len:309 (+) Transcript_7832:723-1649(+)
MRSPGSSVPCTRTLQDPATSSSTSARTGSTPLRASTGRWHATLPRTTSPAIWRFCATLSSGWTRTFSSITRTSSLCTATEATSEPASSCAAGCCTLDFALMRSTQTHPPRRPRCRGLLSRGSMTPRDRECRSRARGVTSPTSKRRFCMGALRAWHCGWRGLSCTSAQRWKTMAACPTLWWSTRRGCCMTTLPRIRLGTSTTKPRGRRTHSNAKDWLCRETSASRFRTIPSQKAQTRGCSLYGFTLDLSSSASWCLPNTRLMAPTLTKSHRYTLSTSRWSSSFLPWSTRGLHTGSSLGPARAPLKRAAR